MKVNEAELVRAASQRLCDAKLVLLHGPDEAGSTAMAARVRTMLGGDTERLTIDGPSLASDPARLVDEASSLSLFGLERLIEVRGGEECLPAVDLLLAQSSRTHPVLIVAGLLKPASSLLKRAISDRMILAYASYKPEGAAATTLVVNIARTFGLRMKADTAAQLAESCGENRAIIEREIEKFANYLDAAPDRPRDLDNQAVEDLGADSSATDISHLVNAVFTGDMPFTAAELGALKDQGTSTIPTLRALHRRALVLARLGKHVESGRSAANVVAAAGKSIFFRDRKAVESQLRQWPTADALRASTRLLHAELALKTSHSAGDVIAAKEITALSRFAGRRKN